MTDLFSDTIIRGGGTKFVTRLNYPQSHEQRLFIENFEMQLSYSPIRSTYNWANLGGDLKKFGYLVTEDHDIAILRQLRANSSQHWRDMGS